ncbi:unnamed protein product [Caretta caretta]
MENDQNYSFFKGHCFMVTEQPNFVKLWCKISKTVGFCKSTRNDHAYQQMVKKLRPMASERSVLSSSRAPSTSTGCCTSTTHPQSRTSLAKCTFMNHSKRKCFCDGLMVELLERTNKQDQYQKKRNLRLEKRHAGMEEERLRLISQLKERVSA